MSNHDSIFEQLTSEEKEQLIQQYLKRKQQQQIPILNRISRNQPLLVSFLQEDRLSRQTSAEAKGINVFWGYHLKGKLNTALFLESFQRLIQRHEALRTTFDRTHEPPLQIIDDEIDDFYAYHDLMLQEEQQAQIDALINEALTRRFNTDTGPLFSVAMIRITPEYFILLFSASHLIIDGISIGIMLRELSETYNSLCNGDNPNFPSLDVQYVDFAIWERNFVTQNWQKLIDFWNHELAKAPVVQSPFGAKSSWDTSANKRLAHTVSLELDEALVTNIMAYTQENKVTLFAFFLSVYILAMHEQSQQDLFYIVSPHARRAHVEEIVGWFSQAMVLKYNVDENTSFEVLQHMVMEKVAIANTHIHIPAAFVTQKIKEYNSHIMDELVGFSLEYETPLELSALNAEPIVIQSSESNFAINLRVVVKSDGIILNLISQIHLKLENNLFLDRVSRLTRKYTSTMRL